MDTRVKPEYDDVTGGFGQSPMMAPEALTTNHSAFHPVSKPAQHAPRGPLCWRRLRLATTFVRSVILGRSKERSDARRP